MRRNHCVDLFEPHDGHVRIAIFQYTWNGPVFPNLKVEMWHLVLQYTAWCDVDLNLLVAAAKGQAFSPW